MNIEKYAYSFDRFEGFISGENTIKETLKMIKNEDEGYHAEVFIGEAHCLRPKISASCVIEQLQEDAYDQADESAESYLSVVSDTEYKELETKTTKLRDFLINKIDKTSIDNLNKDLLIAQLKAMEAYLTILSIRIGLNQPTQEEKQLDEAKALAKSTINE